MTRDEFLTFLDAKLQEIRDKFNRKNDSYGVRDDVFHNFRETARRIYSSEGSEAMFRVLLTLEDKHTVSLCKNGLADPEVEDRLEDRVVYNLIALAMCKEAKESAHREHEWFRKNMYGVPAEAR
ncbi:hypothetical protein [Gelria sp. Kuro-4]|uniref:hypothetical protein n=1 Tax=Gelria sp. Kuro-4 TaxID=2796927 RepID=UPI001BEECD38|nr:hypothetical protein [Gelria sp. Kuro-4]BCV23276.1 hypothetical protein kuro4_00490 [Gelria sp. Kuro-4]